MSIEVKNVFKYYGEQAALNDVSFKINSGQTIALVGATGAGKSTIINLLSRFYDLNKGEILVDAININDYKSPKPVIAIPLNYIQKDLKGNRYVLVAENKKAAKRNITLGKEYGGRVEIKEGLSDSDLLITSGYNGLNEGDAIEIKK